MNSGPSEGFSAAQLPEKARAMLVTQKNIAAAFCRMAQTEDGKIILAFLERFTARPVPLEMLPHGAVHKEGQRWLLHEIREQISQGERVLNGG